MVGTLLLDEPVSGRFWLGSSPERVVPGRMLLRKGRPRVELLGALSPIMQEVPSDSPGVTSFVPADDRGPEVLYGVLMGRLGRVTVLDAQQVRITAASFAMISAEPNHGLQEEVFEGSYAVIGDHLEGREATIRKFRFRIAEQDPWLHHSGLSMAYAEDRSVSINYETPANLTAPLPDGRGTLTLSAAASVSPPRIAGAYVDTTTWLEVDLVEGITVHEAWRRFPTVASVLLTLVNDRQCPPVAFEVRSEENRWCPVLIPGISADPADVRSSKLPEAALIDRTELGLERLAAWFDLADRFSPLAHIIAGAVGATDRTVSNRLLELATVAEGMHRRLHPGARRLSEQQVKDALAALSESDVDLEARQILCSAMGIYLFEPSFPQRLKKLVEEVEVAVPGVAGRANRWKAAVTEARIGFAHSIGGGPSDADAIFRLHVLATSLRWLLTGRLLLELGVPADQLGRLFSRYERYRNFLRNSARDYPRIYPSPNI